jgi:hypothetical protein
MSLELYFVTVCAKEGKALVVGYLDKGDLKQVEWGDPPMPAEDVQRIRDEFGGQDGDE